MSIPNRDPQGVPTGGRFAHSAKQTGGVFLQAVDPDSGEDHYFPDGSPRSDDAKDLARQLAAATRRRKLIEAACPVIGADGEPAWKDDRIVRNGMGTPWGEADYADRVAPGIGVVGTPGHGGLKLSQQRNAAVDPIWRRDDAWYEEDGDQAIVVLTHPDAFTDSHYKQAFDSARNHMPDEFEHVIGQLIKPGESFERDARAFQELHKDDHVTISAQLARGPVLLHDDDSGNTSIDATGMVVVRTRVGGHRPNIPGQPHPEQRTYLVTREEYEARERNGMVIDPARHTRLRERD